MQQMTVGDVTKSNYTSCYVPSFCVRRERWLTWVVWMFAGYLEMCLTRMLAAKVFH